MKAWIVATSLISFSVFASADSRIITEVYDSNRVYDIYTQVGRATLIQFEADESIADSPSSVLGIGDAKAWTLGARGNNIVFKPAEKTPQTNIVVVTNKRTYSFDLRDATKANPPTYVIKFFYRDSHEAKLAAEAKRIATLEALKAEPIEVNTEYFWKGSNPMLRPTSAWDDGRFTRMMYDHAGELPLFFTILPDGSEALLNYNVDPDDKRIVILHEVIRTIRVRLGKDVIEIVNKGYQLPKFNTKGAGIPGAMRVDKGARQ